MGDYEKIGDTINAGIAVVIIAIPLALWKAIEIIIWALNHIQITSK